MEDLVIVLLILFGYAVGTVLGGFIFYREGWNAAADVANEKLARLEDRWVVAKDCADDRLWMLYRMKCRLDEAGDIYNGDD